MQNILSTQRFYYKKFIKLLLCVTVQLIFATQVHLLPILVQQCRGPHSHWSFGSWWVSSWFLHSIWNHRYDNISVCKYISFCWTRNVQVMYLMSFIIAMMQLKIWTCFGLVLPKCMCKKFDNISKCVKIAICFHDFPFYCHGKSY